MGAVSLILIVTGAALGWTETPFAAIALLLVAVPLMLAVGLILAVFGRWGRRATRQVALQPALCVTSWVVGGGFVALSLISAVVGDEELAAVPLLILALLFMLPAWKCQVVVACRLMHWLVLSTLLAVLLAGGGFGVGALVRGDEIYGGVALLGVALWLGLFVLLPWMAICRTASQSGRLFGGAGLVFLISIPILLIGIILLIVNGLPRGDDKGGLESVVTTDIGQTAPDSTIVQEPGAAEDPQVAEPPAEETPTEVTVPEVTVPEETPTEETVTEETAPEDTVTEDAAEPIPTELAELGDMLGVPADKLAAVYDRTMTRTPNWIADGTMPPMLGPDWIAYGGGKFGTDVVIFMEFATPLTPTQVLGAGSQLQVLVSVGSEPASDADADQLRALTPGQTLESFDPRNGFQPINDGAGATLDRFAMFVIPSPGPDAYFRLVQFYRYTVGDLATEQDPTATDSGTVARVVDDYLVPQE